MIHGNNHQNLGQQAIQRNKSTPYLIQGRQSATGSARGTVLPQSSGRISNSRDTKDTRMKHIYGLGSQTSRQTAAAGTADNQ